MSMKECPSCGTMVPDSATRCKNCFQDFDEDLPPRSGGPIFLLGAFASMALIAAMTLYYVTSSPIEEKILVDQETQSVVWTKVYRSGVETDRLKFTDIAKLEYVVRADGGFEVVAVTFNGDRRVIKEDVAPIKSDADRYASLMEKPLEQVDKTHGFHKGSNDP